MMDYGDNTAEALDSEKEHIGASTYLINQFNKICAWHGLLWPCNYI